MKRAARLLLFGWLALAGAAVFGAERLLPPGTPVFSEPLHTAPLVTAVWEETPVEAGPVRTVLVTKHPLARHYAFFPVPLPDGRRLVHMDLYRLRPGTDLDSIGFDEYLQSGALIAIEWAERAADALPPDTLNLHFDLVPGDDTRRVARFD